MQTSSLTGTFILVESCPLNWDFLLSAICRHQKIPCQGTRFGWAKGSSPRKGVMWGMLAAPRNSQGCCSTDGLQDCWEAHLSWCADWPQESHFDDARGYQVGRFVFCAWDWNQGTLIFRKIVRRVFEPVWRFLRISQFQKDFAILPSTHQTTLTCWKIG